MMAREVNSGEKTDPAGRGFKEARELKGRKVRNLFLPSARLLKYEGKNKRSKRRIENAAGMRYYR
jgi:hypothetical protein